VKLLVTGAGGILGTELRRATGDDAAILATLPGEPGRHHLVALPREELDVTDAGAVRSALRLHEPDAVVHAAAWTAVDRAESEPRAARRVNVAGTAHVAQAAAALGAVLLYPSTDFVFDGRRDEPYAPDDPPSPLGVYGRTKLEGEEAVRAAGGPHLIVRTSWVYGAGGRDFVDAVLERARAGGELRVVDDQVGRPTWARTLAGTLLELLRREVRGIWHVADAGAVSRYDMARAVLEEAGVEAEVEPVSTEAYGAEAPRPLRAVLDTTATEELLGRSMVPWRRALARYLTEGSGKTRDPDGAAR
jgi:dTDP-4-dehydrorhamnose reductase